MLRSGKHQNIFLQRSFNKYGEYNFDFSILEYGSDLDEIRQKEQKWIDNLDACDQKKGYNLHTLAVGGSAKGELSNNYGNRGLKNPLSISVVQVDVVTREVVKFWGSMRDAKRVTKININHLSGVCKFFNETNFLKRSKGYFWCYADDLPKAKNGKEFTFSDRKPILDHSKKIRRKSENGMSRKVVKLELNGSLISVYDSIVEASEENNINTQLIYNQLFRKPKVPKGFKWMYLNEYEEQLSALAK